MKNFLFVVALLLSSMVHAQKKYEAMYVFNEDGSSAKDVESCYSFMYVSKEDDTTFLCRTYLKEGALLKWETFKDHELNRPHGRFAYYKAGKVDSMGWVFEGKKDRDWCSEYTPKGQPMKIVHYENGQRKYIRDLNQKRIFYVDGRIVPIPEEDTTKKIVDSINMQPANFDGGLKKWSSFLSKNLQVPERMVNKAKAWGVKKVKVVVEFSVGTTGSLKDIVVVESFDWSTDTEVLRVLKKSPQWKPAMFYGTAVVFKHRQPVFFAVE